jgi:hypothetical protein
MKNQTKPPISSNPLNHQEGFVHSDIGAFSFVLLTIFLITIFFWTNRV